MTAQLVHFDRPLGWPAGPSFVLHRWKDALNNRPGIKSDLLVQVVRNRTGFMVKDLISDGIESLV